jgi:hypothetical protein
VNHAFKSIAFQRLFIQPSKLLTVSMLSIYSTPLGVVL